ncbi:hypothetical protein OPV22_029115 [Ensete ventricosum]|uniref:GB1/RHD3-type G domain-containing protein n=1 Tax=Ensete ventricosum TaxID=4639 RepID=A0AAV8QAA8_ENSVE|nr:hypothetical protein OPV22_029115 [Ensete ventricosum]
MMIVVLPNLLTEMLVGAVIFIGREQAANKPLLKTIFKVMMRLFSPRKTALLFVIRDKTKTLVENLEPILKENIQMVPVTNYSRYLLPLSICFSTSIICC